MPGEYAIREKRKLMLKKKEDIKPVIIENMKGGEKYVQRYNSVESDSFTGNADVVARLVLIPGATIGYHEHVGNEEAIMVISGTARCTDDGEVYEMHPGDVTICREHHFHGIENASADGDLEIYAVVIKTDR